MTWGGGGAVLLGVDLEDMKHGDDHIKQMGVRAGRGGVRGVRVEGVRVYVGAGGGH